MSEDPLVGRTLGTFRIERLLGRGGMARVLYGWDTQLDRPVAVKVFDPLYSRDSAPRFIREARAIARWRHENIVQVYYAATEGDISFFVMEYIDGEDLGSLLNRYKAAGRPMPLDMVLRIIEAITSALDYAHARGVVHRDIKPSNIMLAQDGRVVLTDFGLFLDTTEGSMGEIFGSPKYIAPEQAISSAHAVPQSDLYSLGAVLYHMLTGQPVFDVDGFLETALLHINEPPPPPRSICATISPAVEAVVLKTLAKQPEERYQSGAALYEALEEAIEGPLPVAAAAELVLPPVPAAVVKPSRSQGEAARASKVVVPAGERRSRRGGGRAVKSIDRLASLTQNRWAGSAFALLVLALLAWLDMAGHPAMMDGRFYGWFVPAGLVSLAVWLLYRRWWLLAGSEGLVLLAVVAVALNWGRWIAWAAIGVCVVLAGWGVVYLVQKGGALSGMRQQMRQRLDFYARERQERRQQEPRKEEKRTPRVIRTAEEMRTADPEHDNLIVSAAEMEKFLAEPEPAPEPVAAGAPRATGAQRRAWSALAGWWEEARQRELTLEWLLVQENEIQAGLSGYPREMEAFVREGAKVWGKTVTRSEIRSGYLVLSCRPGESSTEIPEELRMMVPVGVQGEGELWLCLAGTGHVIYVAEDLAGPSAALRAAAIALIVQMKQVRVALYDPSRHLASLRPVSAHYSSSRDEFDRFLQGELYRDTMRRLAAQEQGQAVTEPWWIVVVGDCVGLESSLETPLATGKEARIAVLALASPRTDSGQHMVRQAEATVCYPLYSAETSWNAIGHAGAAELDPGEVLVTLESSGGALRELATAVCVEDAVVATVLRRKGLQPMAASQPVAQPATQEVPKKTAPATSEAISGVPDDVRAVLLEVFAQGKFGVRSIYEAVQGKVPRDRVMEIGQSLEELGIVGPAQGRRGREISAGMTLEQAAVLWTGGAAPVEAASEEVGPAEVTRVEPTPTEAAPLEGRSAAPAEVSEDEIPAWLLDLLQA